MAQRLESVAPPDEVLVGAQTARLLGGAARLEPLGPLTLKGQGRAGRRVAPGGDAAGGEAARTAPSGRLVGRERELAALHVVLEIGLLLERARPAQTGSPKGGPVSRREASAKRRQRGRSVTDLTEKLRGSETMIVADYRGLTMTQIDALRTRLIENGARFTVVKNTLTRRAAEAAGADALLALLRDRPRSRSSRRMAMRSPSRRRWRTPPATRRSSRSEAA